MSEPKDGKGGPRSAKSPAKSPVAPPAKPVTAAPVMAPIMKVRPAAKPPEPAPQASTVAIAKAIESADTLPVPVEMSAAPAVEHMSAPTPVEADVTAAPEPVAAPKTEPVVVASAVSDTVAPSKPVPVAASVPTPAFTRGIFNMATSFDTAASPAAAAQKVQAVFGGMNDRAKSAMEKGTKLGEELTELTKGNVEALVASTKIAAKGAESLAQEAAEYGKKNFESTTALFKSLAGVKSPTELFQLQSDFAKSSFDSAVAEASKMSEAFVKLAGEFAQPISNRYAVAAEKLKASAL